MINGEIFDAFDLIIHLSINSDEVFGDGVTSMPTCVTLAANSLSLLPILFEIFDLLSTTFSILPRVFLLS